MAADLFWIGKAQIPRSMGALVCLCRYSTSTSTCEIPYYSNSARDYGAIRSPETEMGMAGGHPTVGRPQIRPRESAAATVSRKEKAA